MANLFRLLQRKDKPHQQTGLISRLLAELKRPLGEALGKLIEKNLLT
jgi:hypothetical protein